MCGLVWVGFVFFFAFYKINSCPEAKCVVEGIPCHCSRAAFPPELLMLRAAALWVPLCFGKTLEQRDSTVLWTLTAALAFFERADGTSLIFLDGYCERAVYGTSLIFPVKFITFVSLEFILNICSGQSQG